MKKNRFRIIILCLFIIVFSAFFVFDLGHFLKFDYFLQIHIQLKQAVHGHFLTYALIFVLIYWASVGLSIPGASFLTIIGGYLFGFTFGAMFVLVGATLGACSIFLLAKTVFGEFLHKKASGWVKKLEKGFQANAFFYLLFLRLLPLFPFWLINIVPALFNMRLRSFALATLIGIIPGSLIYVSLGTGLGLVLEQGESLDFGIIFEPKFLIPMIGLAIIMLLPILYKTFKKKKAA